MRISDDSYAMLLVCSDLALRADDDSARAFSVSQWSKIAERLAENELTPKALFSITSELQGRLGINDGVVNRIQALLARSAQLGIALSNLNDRGIFALTRADQDYPHRLKKKLKKLAPPVLYYAGNLALFGNKAVAIVGSRNIDPEAAAFAERLSKCCTLDGLNIVSGGARGVDTIAENVANNMDGTTVIVVADSMENKIRKREVREAIIKKQTIVLSAFRPDVPFAVHNAMERNKYIYAMSDYAVVVSSDLNKGGTWAGATENLKHGWVPLFVRDADEGLPEGNRVLLQREGAFPITAAVLGREDANGAEGAKGAESAHMKDVDMGISDWFALQVERVVEQKKKTISGEPQQIALFELEASHNAPDSDDD